MSVCNDCPCLQREDGMCWLVGSPCYSYVIDHNGCVHAPALQLAKAGTHILKAVPIGVAGFMKQGEATTYTGGMR